MRGSSSTPAIVTAARSKTLKPSMGPMRDSHALRVLLDHVVEVLRRSQPRVSPAGGGGRCSCSSRTARCAPEADLESSAPCERMPCGSLHVAVGAQAKVHRLAVSIGGTIGIRPPAADLHIGLVDAPGSTSFASESIPPLLKLGHETLDSARDRRVGQSQAALGHQFSPDHAGSA